jgi:Ca2+-binding RTX toxin-like protein
VSVLIGQIEYHVLLGLFFQVQNMGFFSRFFKSNSSARAIANKRKSAKLRSFETLESRQLLAYDILNTLYDGENLYLQKLSPISGPDLGVTLNLSTQPLDNSPNSPNVLYWNFEPLTAKDWSGQEIAPENIDLTAISYIYIQTLSGGDIIRLNGLDLSLFTNLSTIEIYSGAGDDTIDLSTLNVTASSSLAYIAINGESGNDIISGSSFAESIDPGANHDIVYTGGGADQIMISGFGAGQDIINIPATDTNNVVLNTSYVFGNNRQTINWGTFQFKTKSLNASKLTLQAGAQPKIIKDNPGYIEVTSWTNPLNNLTWENKRGVTVFSTKTAPASNTPKSQKLSIQVTPSESLISTTNPKPSSIIFLADQFLNRIEIGAGGYVSLNEDSDRFLTFYEINLHSYVEGTTTKFRGQLQLNNNKYIWQTDIDPALTEAESLSADQARYNLLRTMLIRGAPVWNSTSNQLVWGSGINTRAVFGQPGLYAVMIHALNRIGMFTANTGYLQKIASLTSRDIVGVNTIQGDFDTDGYVTDTDFTFISVGYGNYYQYNHSVNQVVGDIDQDGYVTDTDFTLYMASYGNNIPSINSISNVVLSDEAAVLQLPLADFFANANEQITYTLETDRPDLIASMQVVRSSSTDKFGTLLIYGKPLTSDSENPSPVANVSLRAMTASGLPIRNGSSFAPVTFSVTNNMTVDSLDTSMTAMFLNGTVTISPDFSENNNNPKQLAISLERALNANDNASPFILKVNGEIPSMILNAQEPIYLYLIQRLVIDTKGYSGQVLFNEFDVSRLTNLTSIHIAGGLNDDLIDLRGIKKTLSGTAPSITTYTRGNDTVIDGLLTSTHKSLDGSFTIGSYSGQLSSTSLSNITFTNLDTADGEYRVSATNAELFVNDNGQFIPYSNQAITNSSTVYALATSYEPIKVDLLWTANSLPTAAFLVSSQEFTVSSYDYFYNTNAYSYVANNELAINLYQTVGTHYLNGDPTFGILLSGESLVDYNNPGYPANFKHITKLTIYGSSSDDAIDLSGFDRTYFPNLTEIVIDGGTGNDTIIGSTGNDTLIGGEGDDTLDGGLGDDRYVFTGYSPLGTDKVIEATGAGTDTLDFSQFYYQSQGVNVDLNSLSTAYRVNGGLKLDLSQAFAIENLIGTDYSDYLIGNDLDNTISGLGGADYIFGRGGNDTLFGNDGNDVINGGSGNDTISGGSGNDTLGGGAGDDTVNGDDGNDNVSGDAGNDDVDGGPGNDDEYQDEAPNTAPDFTSEIAHLLTEADYASQPNSYQDIYVDMTDDYGYGGEPEGPEQTEFPIQFQIAGIDKEDDELTFTIFEGPEGASISSEGNLATISWTVQRSDAGETYKFVIQVSDDVDPSLSSYQNYYVVVRDGSAGTSESLNWTPVARDDVYQLLVNTTLTGQLFENDYDIDNQTITVDSNDGDAFDVNADGTFTYTPDINYTGTETFTYFVYDQYGHSNTATVSFVVHDLPGIDIDTDSDNNLVWELSQAEDDIEMDNPGKYVYINSDDDNNNGIADFNDAPFNPSGASPTQQEYDDDLIPFRFNLNYNSEAQSQQVYDVKLVFENSPNFKVWDSRNKNVQLFNGDITVLGSNTSSTYYVEGIASGEFIIKAYVIDDSDYIDVEDSIRFTVVNKPTIDLDVDSDNDGTIDPDNTVNGTDDYYEDLNTYAHTIYVLSGDIDNDNIIDSADYGIPGGNFALSTLAISADLGEIIAPETVQVTFIFNDAGYESNGSGKLRLWKLDADANRTSSDIIESGVAYSAHDLGFYYDSTLSYYIEAVAGALDNVFETITVTMTIPGITGILMQDVVNVKIVQVDIDLDIDSDNNNGINLPDFSAWEEELESSPYGLGKLVYQSSIIANQPGNPILANNFTPVVITLSKNIPLNNNLRITVDYPQIFGGPAGLGRIWLKDKPQNPNPNTIDNGGDYAEIGTEYTTQQLGYNANTGQIVLYIDGANTTFNKQLIDVETNGRGNEGITMSVYAKRNGISKLIGSDFVKYIVVNSATHYYHDFQTRKDVRAALAARASYDIAPDRPDFSLKQLNNADLQNLGLQPNEIALLTAPDPVTGFQAVLYQDYAGSRKEYILAFAGTQDGLDWDDNIPQGLGWGAPQYDQAMKLADAILRQANIPIDKLVTSGHSLGGGLASAASVVTGYHGYTYNSAGLHEDTLYQRDALGKIIEINGVKQEQVAGSLPRFQAPLNLVDAHYLDWDLLSLLQDWIPGVYAALGSRTMHDGPYDSALALELAWISAEIALGGGWARVASMFAAGAASGFILVKAHFMDAMLYGMLADESIDKDFIGYTY